MTPWSTRLPTLTILSRKLRDSGDNYLDARRFQDSAEVIDGEDPLASIASGKECCISMVWRSSMKDLACVMIVSCALVKDFGAVVSYEGGAPMEISDLLFATRELLRGVTNEVSQETPPK